MNVVIVKHENSAVKYIFLVPETKSLKAGDLVKVNTKRGNALETCLCDSFVVDTTDKEKQKLFSMLLEQMSQQLMSLVSLHMMNGSD